MSAVPMLVHSCYTYLPNANNAMNPFVLFNKCKLIFVKCYCLTHAMLLFLCFSSSAFMLRSSHQTTLKTQNQAVVPFAAEKIRVGRDYQAICPELEPVDQRKPDQISDRALLVWSPTADISDIKCKYFFFT